MGLGQRREAAAVLEQSLRLAPDFTAARYDYAGVLFRLHRFAAALSELERLLASDPTNPLFRQLQATVLENMGELEQTLAIRKSLLAENQERAETWVSYGHALRALGRQEESAAAYRGAIERRPSCGAAYWALANMKTVRFTEAELETMRTESLHSKVSPDDRIALQFALGKAYEDARLFDKSFEQYAKANAAMRLRLDEVPEAFKPRAGANKAVFTRDFLDARKGAGCDRPDPIFVVGKPRSGTTLVEQILSSHSMIEGTGELPYIAALATELRERNTPGQPSAYPELVASLNSAALREIGERYLDSAKVHRRLGRPFFIDKKPANHFHIGLIHLALPKARIIDVRRNPAACCFSMYKQYFSTTNLRLSELGEIYRDYVEMMAFFDQALPGKIHRVVYEEIVQDPEGETRKLLAHLQLPFEENCLRFYESKRAVLTPSSEQVRRPISGESLEHWRNYERHLGPLLRSLGTVLTSYPKVPEELQ